MSVKFQLPLSGVDIFALISIYYGWEKNEDLKVILDCGKSSISMKMDKFEKLGLIARKTEGKNILYKLTKKSIKLIENNFIYFNSSFLIKD